jgi:hypothetical protein
VCGLGVGVGGVGLSRYEGKHSLSSWQCSRTFSVKGRGSSPKGSEACWLLARIRGGGESLRGFMSFFLWDLGQVPSLWSSDSSSVKPGHLEPFES